jgi:hypothetical protein
LGNYFLLYKAKLYQKNLSKTNKSPNTLNSNFKAPQDSHHISNARHLTHSVTYHTAAEARENMQKWKKDPDIICVKIFIPDSIKDKTNEEDVWDYLADLEKKELTKQIKEEIKLSQRNFTTNESMIPLCVSFEEKDLAKQVGCTWDWKNKTWFWPLKKERNSVAKWLPKFYQDNDQPCILPRLVPQPLWYLNLRSLLEKSEWDDLRKKVYKKANYRCTICGCQGDKWPVECDEIWSYEDNHSETHSMVHFAGLQALCPGCHQICHFGKTMATGAGETAMARMMFLNNWTHEEAQKTVDHAFKEWEARSSKQWLLNTDILENDYGVAIKESSSLKQVS